MVNCQTIIEVWRFLDFSKWRPSAILNLLYMCLHHLGRVYGGLYHCAKLGWNRSNSFDNASFITLRVRFENAYLRPQNGVLGYLTPKLAEVSLRPPKSTSLRGNTSCDVLIVKIGPLVRAVREQRNEVRRHNKEPKHVTRSPRPPMLLYIGWQWRNFFISYLCQLFFRHVVGQALQNVSYSDITSFVR